MSSRELSPTTPDSGPGRMVATAVALVSHQVASEWQGSPVHLISLGGRRPDGVAAEPHDLRPADPARGAEILQGRWMLAGATMAVGPGGDPWDRPSPSLPFAQHLHQMGWLADLLAHGEPGEREALRLILDWRRVFGRWNAFSWEGAIVERRVFNVACALKRACVRASDAEAAHLTDSLARQSRHLLSLKSPAPRAAERACAAALAGLTLGGPAGARIADLALGRLDAALAAAVLADGGHASRSPQAGLELLLDLLALDDALSQRGKPAPEELPRAIDRLAAALRVLTLPDGRLPRFQGGEAGLAAHVKAAFNACDLGPGESRAAADLPHTRYQRLSGRTLTVVVDAGAPAADIWSETACAQPLAIEVLCGSQRLITNSGWSPAAGPLHGHRLTGCGSTVAIEAASAGAPLVGASARALGPRLAGGAAQVERELHETPEGVWFELSHDGWVKRYGLQHRRLLYLDLGGDELRGEERLLPVQQGGGRSRFLPMSLRFHLAPEVRASVARDGHSVLLQRPGSAGWWLRNDAGEVAIEPSLHFEGGAAQRTSQVVMRRGIAERDGGRIRWKLTPVASEKA